MKNKKQIKANVLANHSKSRLRIYLILLVAIPLALYFRAINYQFSSMDDTDMITAVYNINGGTVSLKDAFTHDSFMTSSSFYRPVQTISFMLDEQFASLQPWIYHLSNIILHILTVITLFSFLKKTGLREEISFLLAMLFAVHPLLTDAAAWVPARGDLLLTLFSLLSFITFLLYTESRKKINLVLHGLFFLLALFSKETVILLPVLMLSYLYIKPRKDFKLTNTGPFILIWTLSFIAFYSLRQGVIKNSLPPYIFGITPLIKNLPVIPITFGKFFLPINLSTLPQYDSISLITGLLIIIVITSLFYIFIKGDRRFAIWGACWFLAFSIPPMLLRLPGSDFGFEYFENRAYLPAAGILVIIGLLANELFKKFSFNNIIRSGALVILIYGVITIIHLPAFSEPISFFTSAVDASSGNALALFSRGNKYKEAGNYQQAMIDYNNAIKVCSIYSGPYFSIGEIYKITGDLKQSDHYYSVALDYDTLYKNINILYDKAYLSLSAVKIQQNKFEDALTILNKADQLYPGGPNIFNNMGYAYAALGNYDKAINYYDRAILIDPNTSSYYNNRARARFNLKDYQGSLTDFNTALDLDPGLHDAYLNRGIVKLNLSDFNGAISDFNTAINYNANSAQAYYFRGMAFSKLNKTVESARDMEEAHKLGIN